MDEFILLNIYKNNDNDLFSEDEIDKNEIINNEENLNLNNDDESKENNLIEN